MDCVIPGHSVRLFCSSISCLSKIGKDLYVELDVATGCTLRALNDAKSAYACMRFAPSFFERCTTPPSSSSLPSSAANSRNRRRSSNDNSSSQDDQRFSTRIAIRALAPVVKARKDVVQLRITSMASPLRLAFEFLINKDNSMIRIVHCIPAADADAVSAVAVKTRASELTCRPKTLLRLLEPLLKLRISEVALTVEKDAKVLSAQSFHHSDTIKGSSVLQHQASHVKTETCMSIEELEDLYFQDDRSKEEDGDDAPENVNSGVVLVFPIREARAWLQFGVTHEFGSTMYFHWGGRPITLEAVGSDDSPFTSELVLASLDYKLLGNTQGDSNNNNV